MLGLTMVLLFSFSTNILDYIWHGLNYPDSLPARQSFIYIFLVLVMSFEAFYHIREINRETILYCFFGGVFFLLFCEKFVEDTDISWGLELLSMAFLAIYAAVIYYYHCLRIALPAFLGYTVENQTYKGERTMSVMHITKENFDAVVNGDKPVLLDFWATWCGPCRMVAPIVEEIAAERDDIVVGKVNVDEEMELAVKFGIISIPTLILLKNGMEVDKIVGYRPKADIEDMLA